MGSLKLLIAVLITVWLVSPGNINNSVQEPVNAQPVQATVQESKRVEPSPQPQTEPKPEKPQEAVKPVVATVSHPVGCEQYRDLVARYDWNVNVALNVMRAESGCNPTAVGDGHLTYFQNGTRYGMSCGLFQVRFLPGRPSCSEMQNPEANIAKAFKLYASGGWRHWTVCNKRIVSCY